MKNLSSLILAIFATLLFSSDVFCQQDNSLEQAEHYYNLQEYGKALKIYEDCISSDSLNLNCHQKAAMSAYRLGDVPLARKLFLNVEKMDSTNRVALSQLATIYEQQKNTPKTILYYNKLIKLFPDNAIYYRKIAQQFQSAGILVDAFQNYAKALKLNERDLFTIKGLSEILLSNKEYEQCDSLIHVGLDLDTLNISLHFLMAQSKYRQKTYDSTVVYLSKILGQVDFSPYYNKMLGYSFIQIDSFEKAIPVLHKSLSDPGTKENAHYYLATAYYKLDSMEFSKFHYEEALKEGISGNVDLYHRALAKMYNEEKQYAKAIEHYKDGYKYGKDPLVLFYLARACDIYYKDKSIAINYYKKYYKSNHSNSEYIKYSKSRARQLREEMHLKAVN